ncbi:MAG: TetR/AcrR family transcriptional regulator [Actinobacteria bacterium]|nr:TetR/AcrR family transcriptional regulator [Actinomycetota bacterium]
MGERSIDVAAVSAPKRRGRPADQDSQETRATILATAQRLFGEAGFKGVSMERLARDAGLTVRALYHYFPSKRALFKAATAEALQHFGDEVATRVFVHESLTDRVSGFIDVYRALYASDPHVLAFIGMVLVDAISEDLTAGGQATSGTSADLQDASLPVVALNEALVDQALARGEVHPDVDREGAMLLLETMGMGLALAALNDTGSFPKMLDALQRLNDGSLYRPLDAK